MKVAAEGAGSRQGGLWARRLLAIAAVLGLGLGLSACNFDLGGEAKYPVPRQKGQNQPQYEEEPGVFGEGGIFGPDLPEDSTGGGIGVNNLLWRASLDTVSFMPLVSADPFGGVIITDWYTPAETPNERMKVQVTILDRELRADGVRVSVFKQQTSPKGGNWVDAQVDPRTNIDIENAILTRARQLRIAGGS
jgi:Domain of unknown function (DUF3576)